MVCKAWSQHVLGMMRWQNGTVQWGYSLYLCFRLLFGQWSHSKQSSWSSHRVHFFWSSGYAYALIVLICLCISEKTVCTREFIAFWRMKCVSEFVGSLQCLTSSSSVFVKSYHCSICTSVLLLTSLCFRVWVPLFPVSLDNFVTSLFHSRWLKLKVWRISQYWWRDLHEELICLYPPPPSMLFVQCWKQLQLFEIHYYQDLKQCGHSWASEIVLKLCFKISL